MAITLVQEAHGSISGTSLSVSISPTGSGNLIVVMFGWLSSATTTPITVSDGVNTYIQASSGTANNSIYAVSTWYAFNSIAGATSVSVSEPGRGVSDFLAVSVQEFSGVDTSSPFISANTLMFPGTAIGPSLTPTHSNQLLVTYFISTNAASWAVGAPWSGTAFSDSGDAHYSNPPLSVQQAVFNGGGSANSGATGAIFSPLVVPLTLTLSDSVSSGDTTVKEDEKQLTDSVTQADSLALARGQSVSDSVTMADSFSLQSSFLASVPTPIVETLTNLVIPAEVKIYYKIQE